MKDLQKSLKICGYQGPCESEQILRWAIRTGACSEFYKGLLTWLEDKLQTINCTTQVRKNIMKLLDALRISILMIPHHGSEVAANPKEFRLQSIKTLLHQLQLARMMAEGKSQQQQQHQDSPEKGPRLNAIQKDDRGVSLHVTVNTKNSASQAGFWNERLVRYKPSYLEMFQ